jgi:diacylglycerol kinase (ATP)
MALAEICDLEEYCAFDYLERVRDFPKVRIIVCGGDGTVGRIMDQWKSIASATTETEFGIIPLGTGNDMFKQLVKQYRRMTKYQMPAMYCRKPADELGVKIISYSSPKVLKKNPSDIYRLFRHPVVVPLDRWLVYIKTPSQELRSPSSIPSSSSSSNSNSETESRLAGSTMNNYFGIGVDGAVSLAFDKLRQRLPFLFFHRNMNKVWYAAMGACAFVTRGNPDISNICKLSCDGEDVPIPAGTQGIIILNINSYAG